jgi:hypothetical protein
VKVCDAGKQVLRTVCVCKYGSADSLPRASLNNDVPF